ncbi:MAG: phosphodiester glycosidase family protein [Thermoanaerobaculia bacterium]
MSRPRPRRRGWTFALLALVAAALPPAGALPLSDRWKVQRDELAPGLTHLALVRAAPTGAGRFVVVAGSAKDQKECDRILAAVESAGFEGTPVYSHDEYSIEIVGLPSREEAEAARAALSAVGLATAPVRESDGVCLGCPGPLRVHVLEAAPGSVTVRVAHAYDTAIDLEPTREVARRHGALAAINGGFFRMKGAFAGDSEGVLKMDGVLLSEPDRGRAGVGFVSDRGRERAVFDRLDFRGEARFDGGARVAIDGIDRERRPGELVLYTPAFHRTTLTGPDGTEVVVEKGVVREVRPQAGSTRIPDDGLVLSFAAPLPPGIESGVAVEVETGLVPKSGADADLWAGAHSALGAGPLLLRDGRSALDPAREAISRVFAEARHPRTAAAVRSDGTLLFVVVDGRRPAESVGMTLAELAGLLLELGASDAVNLDGGGSSTMIVRGETVNHPSDESGDRANGDAVLIFPR